MSEQINEVEVANEAPSYDPSKKYTWSTEHNFTISGGEFGLILNALRAITNTPEAHAIFLADRAAGAVESVLSRGVEAGFVKEVEDTPKNTL
jgi:hypothetical protein